MTRLAEFADNTPKIRHLPLACSVINNDMEEIMERFLERSVRSKGMLAMLACAALLAGCHGSYTPPPPSGAVVQGAVVGATVFADHATGTEANRKMDADEAATQTTTDATGHFMLPVTPSYDYVVVSIGGTDSLTGKPAMTMLAPAGAQNISPLTTLVALTPPAQQEQVKQTIQSLGVAYDANVATGLTPAAALLVESINTTVAAVTNTLNTGGNTLPTSTVNAIQQTVMAQIATSIQTQTATQLTTPATLTTTLTTAVTNALTTIDATNTNITVTNAATVASDIVAPVVTAVATAVSPSGTFSTSTTSVVPESTIISATDATSLNTVVTTTTTTTSTQVTVVAPPNTPPTIGGTPVKSVVAGAAYAFVPTASDPNAADILTFSIANKPAWATFNQATGALTGTPTTADIGNYSGIVISVTDGMGTPVSLPAFSISVTSVTGSTGSAGGTI